MDEPVSLGPTRPWPLIQAVLWTAGALGGLAALGGGLMFMADGEPLLFSLTMLAGGALLAVLGAMMAGLCWHTALAEGPVIAMSAEGFRDCRISPDRIAWEGLSWGLFYGGKGNRSLQFETPVPIAVRWPMRLLARLNRLTGTPPYAVLSLGTGRSAAELAALMARFREPQYK
jgi:hypothetical protein